MINDRSESEPIVIRRIMGEEKILGSILSREEHKKLACGAFIGCFILAVNLWPVLKPYLDLPPIYFHAESRKPMIYNFSNPRSEVYEIRGDIRIHGISSTIFIASSAPHNPSSWTVRPYGQKMSTPQYKNVTAFRIKLESPDRIPRCNRSLNDVPAIVFSSKGHSGNLFHAFADVLFPLFATSHHFNRATVFLITNHYSPWISKFRAILEKLSKYRLYDIDRENEVLCFSRMIVGLKAPDGFFIHPSESTVFPIGDFKRFIRSAYSLERESVHDPHRRTGNVSRPRMLIISRERSRKLINQEAIGDLARSLGFDVVVKQMSFNNASAAAKLVNSFDVIVGVHGAGLMNMVFLPENAVLVQITPFGLDVEAMICFQWPAQSMKMRYLEYKVGLNESSLLGKYPHDTEVYTDPQAVRNKRYAFFAGVYLGNQDVNPDLGRFRNILSRALELLGS